MHRVLLALACATALCGTASADVSMLDHQAVKGAAAKAGDKKGARPKATGSVALTDATGLEYFINDNITFSTSSSASGAASEASYVADVAADTLNGGTSPATLNDAFDGFNTMCLSTGTNFGPCVTGNANYVIYNNNGASTRDAACNNRQAVFNPQTIAIGGGTVRLSRKVYVPATDSFARWLNIVTNTGATPVTLNLSIANNLGSDSNTTIVSSSSGNAAAELADTWVSTFQNWSGTTSSDPRLGHVLRGATGAVPLAAVNFANGDDNPFWAYTLTLQPGETRIIANFATGQATRAAAAAKASQLAGFPAVAQACMTPTELSQVANFVAGGTALAAPVAVPAGDRIGWIALGLGLLAAGFWISRRRANV
jgi:hypothetical protein